MDISAALTRPEVAALSDPERACDDAARLLESSEIKKNGVNSTFEESLRLKNTLDELEEQGRVEPSWPVLSVLVNCEYRLFALNQNTPLRNNPFLSHWVEAIQRLDSLSSKRGEASDEGLTSNGLNTVRTELIKALLQSRNPSQFARLSPRRLYTTFVERSQTNPFDIGKYVRMLEEEGIYERTPEPPEPVAPLNKNKGKGAEIAKDASRPRLSNFQQWKHDLLDRLQTEPNTAIPELTHLPIELSYLDFLTTLLQEKTLQRFSIDPAPVISDYIQHALRLTEKMGQPSPSESDANINGEGTVDAVADYGREAQTRAIKLLLLFIRNLIRKALLEVEAIYFEIQEICVRYVWIREVREFRAFVEEGGP